MQDWTEKTVQRAHELRKLIRRSLESITREESAPLSLSIGVADEVWGEGKKFAGKDGAAPLEGGGNGAVQRRSVEIEAAGEEPQVVEILHPRIAEAERHHRLEFLGDYGVDGIDAHARRGEIQ